MFKVNVVMMVEKKIIVMVILVFLIWWVVCFLNIILFDIFIDNIVVNNVIFVSVGIINNNKLVMVIFLFKKIIRVVILFVINDILFELILNIIKVVYFINFLGFNFSDIIIVSEIKVVVMLFDIDENKNVKLLIKNISFCLLIWFGIILCIIFWIKFLEFKYVIKVIVVIKNSYKVVIFNILWFSWCCMVFGFCLWIGEINKII